MERADEVIISGKKTSPVGLETPITLYTYPNSQILEEEEQVFIASAKGRYGPLNPYTQIQVAKSTMMV